MLIYLLVVFPAAMVAYGNMTVCELQNSRKDVTQKKDQQECHALKLKEVTKD